MFLNDCLGTSKLYFGPLRGRVNLVQRKQRQLTVDSLHHVLMPPVIFTGLFLALWTYKCSMMILFQNKIIYMPSVPPFSRSEKLSDYERQCAPIVWAEHRIKSSDGVELSVLFATMPKGSTHRGTSEGRLHIIVLYLQGCVICEFLESMY